MPEPESFHDAVEPLIDLLGTVKRADVTRTKHTEQRAEIPDHVRQAVLARSHWRCEWCGSNNRLELDHIIPWSAGGSDHPSNLRALCHTCNEDRSNYVSELDLKIAADNATIPNGTCFRHYYGNNPDLYAATARHRERVYCPQCRSVVLGMTFETIVNEIDDMDI